MRLLLIGIFFPFSSLANMIDFHGGIVVGSCPTESTEVKTEQCVPNTTTTETLYKKVSKEGTESLEQVGKVTTVKHF